ncbi:hypothetical protein LXL04_026763 [Taraxacum kok-saghyz]
MVKLKSSLLLFMAFIVTSSVEFHGSSAIDYHVGDSVGWTTPQDPNFYARWSQSHSFIRFNYLVFNFTYWIHDVAEVTSAAYASCDGHDPISIQDRSPARFNITYSENYYISTKRDDCKAGMKLMVKISGANNFVSV